MLLAWVAWLVSFVWSILTLPLRLTKWALSSNDEAYTSLDHLALNVTKPQTEWLNMGNWEVSV